MRRRLLRSVLALTLLVSSAATVAAARTTIGQHTASGSPCGTRVGREPRVYRHVVWILLENASYRQVVGNPSAPYLNGLARECGLATNYSAVSHPSLPNYIALTAGSTHGIADDAGPSAHPLAGPSLFSQLGTGWRVVAESMPRPCAREDSGSYLARHNPAVYFDRVAAACDRQDAAGPVQPSARFTLIVPNRCDDGHDCPISTVDGWLARELGRLLAAPGYRRGGTAVFITWDEGETASNRVAALVVSPYTPAGTRSRAAFDHYSLLGTTESMLGLHCLAAACRAPSMRRAFGL